MLSSLYIKNFALIDELSIDFHSGFSVITGETGAGKSIILGALGLLMGRRAESRQVKAGEKKCTVEAHFTTGSLDPQLFSDADIDYDEQETILRREVTAQGKSRAFVNDTPVALTTLRAIAQQLIDIHSQHQNLLIERTDFQLSVLDAVADNAAPLADYRTAYTAYQQAERELRELQQSLSRSQAEEEFMRYQLAELQKAALAEGEQEELEQEANTLEHAEDIKMNLYEADTLLSADDRGATDAIRRAQQSLAHIAAVYPPAQEAAERLATLDIELRDIAADISQSVENIDFDPQRLDHVNDRLDLLNTLQQKYHAESVAALLALQHDLAQKLQQIDNSDEALEALNAKADELHAEAMNKALAVSKRRAKAAKAVEQEMVDRLVPLGLPKVRFEVTMTTAELTPSGIDSVQFLFSANTSTPLQPVADVASGGEIARVMLSLKALLSGAAGLPTIIFDEIDTGVSGAIAQKMAQIMQHMSTQGQQVIAITHLPQIAATGEHHYKVEKRETATGTESRMRQLKADEREREVAAMLSGDTVTEAALQNARELLSSLAL